MYFYSYLRIYLCIYLGLKLKDLAPEAPAIQNYTTGEVMGVSSDRLAAKFGVSRADQVRNIYTHIFVYIYIYTIFSSKCLLYAHMYVYVYIYVYIYVFMATD
jgi:hypothetical protein